MTRAVVTGAGGQDGSYLVEQLLADGVEVHTLGPSSNDDERHGATHHVGDVTNVESTRRLVLELAPDEVYNLAAVSSVARSWREPELTALINGTAAVALMETAQHVQDAAGRAVRFVQASSAEIFGTPARSPQDEDTPVRPVNPYGAAKAYAHLMVEVARRRGLFASSLVLYNHESPRRPVEFVTRKITSAAAAIAKGRTHRLRLGSLDVARDWGWAPDYTTAMRLAARAEVPADYVVATGQSHTVAEFVTAAFAHVGIQDWHRHVDVDDSLLRPADAPRLVGDSSSIRDRLGWAPSTVFEDVVARMVDADLEAQSSSSSPSK